MSDIKDVLHFDEGDGEIIIDEPYVPESFLAPAGLEQQSPPRTDAERIKEAREKYANDPKVEKVRAVKCRRPDGSMYSTPLIICKPDLTVGNGIFPGPRATSFSGSFVD